MAHPPTTSGDEAPAAVGAGSDTNATGSGGGNASRPGNPGGTPGGPRRPGAGRGSGGGGQGGNGTSNTWRPADSEWKICLAMKHEVVPNSSTYGEFIRTLSEVIIPKRFKDTHPLDMRWLVENGQVPDISVDEPQVTMIQDPTKPNDPTALIEKTMTSVEKMILKSEVASHVKRREDLKKNQVALWAMIIGQCSLSIQSHLRADAAVFKQKQHDSDIVWLLAEVKRLSAGINDKREDSIMILLDQLTSLFNFYQKDELSNADYLKEFNMKVDLVKAAGGESVFEVGCKPGTDKDAFREEFLGKMLLRKSNNKRFSLLKTRLSESLYVHGKNSYPVSRPDTFELLCREEDERKRSNKSNSNPSTAGDTPRRQTDITMAHVTVAPTPGLNGRVFADKKCFKCNLFGHYSNQCPTHGAQGVQLFQVGVQFAQSNLEDILRLDVWYLDTATTITGCCN